jgi:hypothetical protein
VGEAEELLEAVPGPVRADADADADAGVTDTELMASARVGLISALDASILTVVVTCCVFMILT